MIFSVAYLSLNHERSVDKGDLRALPRQLIVLLDVLNNGNIMKRYKIKNRMIVDVFHINVSP